MLRRSYSHLPYLGFRVLRGAAAAYLLAGGALYLVQDSLLLAPGPAAEPSQHATRTPAGDYFGEVHESSGPQRAPWSTFMGTQVP